MLQTLSQVGTERNKTWIVPFPLDVLRSLFGGEKK